MFKTMNIHFNASYLRRAYQVHSSRLVKVNTATNFEVIRQTVFSHARIMVIGVGSDLCTNQYRCKKAIKCSASLALYRFSSTH